MKRKIALTFIGLFLIVFFVGCAELAAFGNGYLDGSDAAKNGYTLLGHSSSESSCSESCANRGYKLYRYNYNTELCYCK